jgi:hypothetical protein
MDRVHVPWTSAQGRCKRVSIGHVRVAVCSCVDLVSRRPEVGANKQGAPIGEG